MAKKPYDKQDYSTAESRARLDEINRDTFSVGEAFGIDPHSVFERFLSIIHDVGMKMMQENNGAMIGITSQDLVEHVENTFTYRELSWLISDVSAKGAIVMGNADLRSEESQEKSIRFNANDIKGKA